MVNPFFLPKSDSLSCCLPHFTFFEGASCAFKNEAPKRESSLGKGRLLRCQFCRLPPPPHPPSARYRVRLYLFPRLDSSDAAAGGQNLLMPLHRAIFTLVFCCCKLVRAGSYDASKKSHFHRVAPIVSPFRPSIPIITPPRP
jgi:hypothetical protein